MPKNHDPSYYRRRLRVTLRNMREYSGITQREAAHDLDWSVSKIIRIEAGTTGISVSDLRALLQLYRVDDPEQARELEMMARASKVRPWFSRYHGMISPAFAQYLGYEASCSAMRQFQISTVPGMLQTEEYARALHQARATSDAEAYVELLMERQELLDREDSPDMFFILDEAVLTRQTGGADVMRRQLRRIRDFVEHPRISVRIVPFSAGAHPSMVGSFTILQFDDWDEDVLYLERSGATTAREDQQLVAEHLETFEFLAEMSLDAHASGDMITSLIDSISRLLIYEGLPVNY